MSLSYSFVRVSASLWIVMGFPVPMFMASWSALPCSRASRFALATSFAWMRSLVWFLSSKMWGGLLLSMRLVNMAAHPVYGFDRDCLEP